MRRLTEVTGLVPVEYPSTRMFLDPEERAPRPQRCVRRPADPRRPRGDRWGGPDHRRAAPRSRSGAADPKPFLGYSDNTNILNWLWCNGVAGFYGGSTQVHLGAGPGVDAAHAATLRAALLTAERLEITDPGESEDFGRPWDEPTRWSSTATASPPSRGRGPVRPDRSPGRTWGGCIEVIQWILTAGRFPIDPAVLDGAVLLLETSEELIPAREFGWILRSLGERGMLAAVDAVLVARPPGLGP